MTLTIPRAPAVVPATVRVPCRPASDAEAPAAALRMRTRALAAGWAVMLTYAVARCARGTFVLDDDPESGRDKRLVHGEAELESVALRACTVDAYRWLTWERWAGEKWAPRRGYGYSRTAPIHRLSFTGLEW